MWMAYFLGKDGVEIDNAHIAFSNKKVSGLNIHIAEIKQFSP